MKTRYAMLPLVIAFIVVWGHAETDHGIGISAHDAVRPVAFGLFSGPVDFSNTINASFSPGGKTVYFSKSQPGWSGLTIFISHRQNNKWSEPQVASFSGTYRDTDPAVTPDGGAVIFASMRTSAGAQAANYGLYRVLLSGPDAGRVEPLPESINKPGSNELYPSVASDGSLYFLRSAHNTARIYRSTPRAGFYQDPEPVLLPGDAGTIIDSDPTISPDQRFIVFTSNRSDSLGGLDIYIAFRRHDQWCKPQHLDAPINSPSPELATGLSRDGRTLYFASARSAVVQPRSARIDAAGFQSELSAYQNGTLKTYQADIGPWLDSHANAGDCE